MFADYRRPDYPHAHCPRCGPDGDVRIAYVRRSFPWTTCMPLHWDATGEALLVCARCSTTGVRQPVVDPDSFEG